MDGGAQLLLGSLVAVAIALLGLASAERVVRVGNRIQASAAGVDNSPGALFLLNNIVLKEGVLFAYSAYFRSDKKVRFQVWRPVGNESDTTTVAGREEMGLLAELLVVPSVVNQREDIYIISKLSVPCVRVKSGDRVGVFLEESPGAISYKFDASDPRTFALVRNASDPFRPGDTTFFDTLTFPYEFSVAAYIDQDLSQYNESGDTDFVPCPTNLLIPEHGIVGPTVAPQPLPTGRPGEQGSPGPTGAQGPAGPKGEQGPTGNDGEQGSQGLQGLQGNTGSRGFNGSRGPSGPPGEEGPTGPQGEKGDQGERGPPGPPGPAGNKSNSGTDIPQAVIGEDGGFFDDPDVVMGLAVWLLIVTLFLIFLVIVLALLYLRREKQNRESRDNVYVNKVPPMIGIQTATLNGHPNGDATLPDDRTWIGSLKEEAVTNFNNDTIDTRQRLGSYSDLYVNQPVNSYSNENVTFGVNSNGDLPTHEVTNY